MTKRIKLTTAQKSAIECRMHGEEQVDGLLLDGDFLLVDDANAVGWALTEASNAEDDAVEYGYVDGDLAKYARRAAKSLAAIAGRVYRIA